MTHHMINSEDKVSAREILKKLAGKKRMTVTELRSRVHIQQEYIDRWLQGTQSLGLSNYDRLAQVLETSLLELPPVSNEYIVDSHGVRYRLQAHRSGEVIFTSRVAEINLRSVAPGIAGQYLETTLNAPMDGSTPESNNIQAPMNYRWEGFGPTAQQVNGQLAARINVALTSVLGSSSVSITDE